MTPEANFQNPSTPQLDPDLLNAAYSPSIKKTVRGGDKLQGVKPELLDHWNSLQDEFSKAGLTPEIKSGFRTAEQQNALFRNPATAARTKGHDGYASISPHQRGEALDISFPASQRAKGRSIIADYAKRNGLKVPSDEPWHLNLSSQSQPALDPDLLNAGYGQSPKPATDTQLDPDLMKAAYGDNSEQVQTSPVKTPQVTSSVREADTGTELPIEKISPIKFQQATDADTDLNRLARGAQGFTQAVGMQGMKLPSNHPDLLGKKVSATFDHQPNQTEIDDVLMEELGKGYGQVASRFREETGVPLTANNVSIDKQPSGSYLVHARPSQGFIDAVNAYAQGGLPAYESTLNSQNVSRGNVAKDLNTALTQGEGIPQDVAQAGARVMARNAQFGQNAADLLRLKNPETDPNAQAIARAEQSIPSQKTWTGAGVETALGAADAINRAEALGGPAGFPASAAIENIHRGPEAAYKAAIMTAPILAAGPIARAIGADEMSGLGRQLTTRGIAGAGLATPAIASGASPREIGSAFLQGAALPTGERGERERPTELGIGRAPIAGVPGEATANIDQRLAAREAAIKPVTDAQGNVLLNPDEVAQGGKPKIKLANQPAAEPAHLANFRERAPDGTFVEGAAKIPDEFTPENVARETLAEGAKPSEANAQTIAPSSGTDNSQTERLGESARPESVSEDVSRVSLPERQSMDARVADEAGQAVESPPSTTSARKDQLAQDRAELELPELPQAERKSWRTSLINAKEKGLDQRAERLADQVIQNPRALDDEQTAGMVLKLQQLKNEHADLLNSVATETDAEKLAQHRADLESVENSFDKITEAVKASGTEKGRSLASQKLTINQDFDLVSMLNRYKAKTGKEPTPEIRTQIETQQKRIADLEKQLAEKSTKGAMDRIARDVRRENRQRTRKVLDEEAATIKTNLAAEFAKIKSQQGIQPSGLAGLDPEGTITKLALRYAKNRFEAGLTDAAQLVDDVHGVLSEFTDVTKRQVAEMISGYQLPQKPETKESLEKTLTDLRKEMRDALRQADIDEGKVSARPEGPKQSEARRSGIPLQGPKQSEARKLPAEGPRLSEGVGPREGPQLGKKQGPQLREGFRQIEGPRLSEGTGRKQGPKITDAPKVGPQETKAQIQSRFQKQINEIERRIRERDFTPKAKRGPTVLDSDTQKIQVSLERAKQDFQRKLREWQSSQRSQPEKIADLAVKWGRAAKLMYVSTLGKLSSAATGRMVMSPLENLIGEIPHRLMPELSKKATTEGGGFDRAAEVAALWKSGRFRQVLDQLTKGGSDLDVLFGGKKSIDKEMSSGGLLGIPGRVHGALKEYPRQAEFDRAFVKVLKNYDQQGRDITRPDVQLAAKMEAFNSAERARFQQRNFISDTFNSAMGALERKGIAGKATAKVGRFIFPITRVPVNVVGETLNYTFGLPRSVIELAIRGGVKNLTPEQANNIMRAYKKGGVGLAVMAYAFLHPQQFGGYYQKGEKRDPSQPQPGEVMFFGKRIPKVFTHVPILEAAQLAATARRVMDKMADQGKTDATLEGGLAAGKGLAEQVPFYETPARFFTGQEGSRGVAQAAGEQVRGMIPGFIQEAAKATDKDKEGKPIPRNPQGSFAQRFAQTVKLGVPGLRQQVPTNETAISRQRTQGFQDRFLKGAISEKDLDRAAQKGDLTQSEITSILREKDIQDQYTPFQAAFFKAPTLTANKTSTALDRFSRMNEPQRAQVRDIMQDKADAILDSDALTLDQKKAFADRIKALGLKVRTNYAN